MGRHRLVGVGLPVRANRRDELGEPATTGVLAHRDQHFAGQARALPVGVHRDLDGRDRVGNLAAQAGEQPVADGEVPAVVGQRTCPAHHGDGVAVGDDLAGVVLCDDHVLREAFLDVAVVEPPDRVVAHELRPRRGHGPHRLDEVGPVGEDADGEWHLTIVPGSWPSSPPDFLRTPPSPWAHARVGVAPLPSGG
jgi:hypothetical protein